jgi:trimethylamine--corrinoid protein Co-methyltransferase
MIPYVMPQVLSEDEIAKIHAAMVGILARTGLSVEHKAVRDAFADYGARVDHDAQRVWVSESVVQRFVDETQPEANPLVTPSWTADPGCPTECYRALWPGDGKPHVWVRSDVSSEAYLPPGTDREIPFTKQTLADYIKLARLLDNGITPRLEAVQVFKLHPTISLEARLFAWKHSAQEAGGILAPELCPYVLEMYEIKADALGRRLEEVFCASVYVISPLRFSQDICEKIMFFHEKGLRVRIGNYISMGGTGPITLAGCLTLNLAERVAVGILERVLYDDLQWSIYGEMVPLDMTTLDVQVGRPELLLCNLAVIQLARHYGVAAHPFGGTTTARVPSAEAGTQKVMTALPCILAGGCNIDAGKLQESCSPIQMILDSELISALRRLLKGFEVNDDTLAVEVIDALGPGGTFTGMRHTVRHMRSEIWQPRIWQPEGDQDWLTNRRKTDVERAAEIWRELMSQPDPEPGISVETENRLRAVIRRAELHRSDGG